MSLPEVSPCTRAAARHSCPARWHRCPDTARAPHCQGWVLLWIWWWWWWRGHEPVPTRGACPCLAGLGRGSWKRGLLAPWVPAVPIWVAARCPSDFRPLYEPHAPAAAIAATVPGRCHPPSVPLPGSMPFSGVQPLPLLSLSQGIVASLGSARHMSLGAACHLCPPVVTLYMPVGTL